MQRSKELVLALVAIVAITGLYAAHGVTVGVPAASFLDTYGPRRLRDATGPACWVKALRLRGTMRPGCSSSSPLLCFLRFSFTCLFQRLAG
jgi:hypothetical protein